MKHKVEVGQVWADDEGEMIITRVGTNTIFTGAGSFNHRYFYDFKLVRNADGTLAEVIAEKKIVDLSKVVGTQIPMLFGDSESDVDGYLYRINKEWYESCDSMNWSQCEFNTSPDAWVSWGGHVNWYGGKCPIPGGVAYEVVFRDCSRMGGVTAHRWNDEGSDDCVIAFRILGLKEGWEYPE